jgi:hypothetical protein
MNETQSTPQPHDCQEPFRWHRSQSTEILQLFIDSDSPSLRVFAQQQHIPPSSLSYWQRRQRRLAAAPELVAFFESKAGLGFLHGLVLAAHLVFHQSGACGLRTLILFFRLAGLAPFLACSFGAQRRLANGLQDLVLQYGRDQRQRLGPTMPHRKISLCEDETFHDQPCLVAIEAVSNFILVEQYQPHRDAATWNQVIDSAVVGLPVEVVQVASDEAKALLAHAAAGLGAHHSPDLWHLQQHLHRATSLPLHRQAAQAQEAEAKTERQALLALLAQAHYEASPRPGRPPDFQTRIAVAKGQYRQAQQHSADCQQRQQQVQEAIRGLGDDYHPFSTDSAQPVQPEALQTQLAGRLATITDVAEAAGLSQECTKKIGLVRKMVPQLVATLVWFWVQVRAAQAEQPWTAAEQELFKEKVLAWAYWQQAARRGRDGQQRRQLGELAPRCWSEVEGSAAWQGLAEDQRQRMKELARELGGRWVRSSSCVEGRNGWLRLRQHGRQGLSAKGLEVLTVLHNYLSQRGDGTTAAQRFFGQKPDDLFEWLRQRFGELPRPAQPRRKAA